MAEPAEPPDGRQGSDSSSASFEHTRVGQGVGQPLRTPARRGSSSSFAGGDADPGPSMLPESPNARDSVDLTFGAPPTRSEATTPLVGAARTKATLSGTLSDSVGGFDAPAFDSRGMDTYPAPVSLTASVIDDESKSGPSPELTSGPEAASAEPTTAAFEEPDALFASSAVTGGQARASVAAVVRPQSDDPWSGDLVDKLDVQKDALAFARLAALRDVKPPLAVGVFGSWGAGKSFFMRLVHSHIERLAAGEATALAPEAASGAFHSKIVQIRFNAWHYVDTSLWASLVEYIFVELSKATKAQPAAAEPLEALSTARALTLEAARELVARKKEQASAMASFKAASEKLEVVKLKASTSPSIYVSALRNVFSAPGDEKLEKGKTAFMDAARELGVTTDFQQIAGVGTEAEDLVRRGASLAASTKGALRFMASGRGFWVLSILVLLAPGALAYLVEQASQARSQIAEINAQIAAWSATAFGLLAIAGRGISVWRSALDKFESARQVIDQAVHDRLKPLEEEAAQRRAEELAAAEQAIAAEATLRAAGERVVAASNDFHGNTGAGRLVKFVQARASDGHYASHQGLISTIRRDFEELSQGLTNRTPDDPLLKLEQVDRERFDAEVQRLLTDKGSPLSPEDKSKLTALLTPISPPPRPFDRIVLYVDDLDRCPADKVVEVLQAVHMLLAFPLFVVFVAVDVRWVAGSLQQQYSTMFAADSADYHRPQATDYLEKIFQLPYWLPKVAPTTGAQLFDSLVPERRPATSASGSATQGAAEVESIGVVDLELDEGERTLLKAYSAFAGQSPRKLIRYVNVYRLLKAGGYLPELAGMLNYELHALLLQLALATASPEHFDEWMTFVENVDGDSRGPQGILSRLHSPPAEDAFTRPGFEDALAFYAREGMPAVDELAGLHALLHAGALVRRFSFAL